MEWNSTDQRVSYTIDGDIILDYGGSQPLKVDSLRQYTEDDWNELLWGC